MATLNFTSLPTIQEEKIHLCEYCQVSITTSHYCDDCGKVGWVAYNKMFVPMAAQFVNLYNACHHLRTQPEFDMKWGVSIFTCRECELNRQHLMKEWTRMNRICAKMCQTRSSHEDTSTSLINSLISSAQKIEFPCALPHNSH